MITLSCRLKYRVLYGLSGMRIPITMAQAAHATLSISLGPPVANDLNGRKTYPMMMNSYRHAARSDLI